MISKIKNSFDKNKKFELINLEYYKSNYICDKYTRLMIDYIVLNYNKKISIEDISEELGISVSYLSRKFKSETSHTFHDFLNKYRIQKSIDFLADGSYKVYEISDMVGFGEYKHFSSVFKKYMSYSPSEYIKNCIQ